jgi:hypothetical protein
MMHVDTTTAQSLVDATDDMGVLTQVCLSAASGWRWIFAEIDQLRSVLCNGLYRQCDADGGMGLESFGWGYPDPTAPLSVRARVCVWCIICERTCVWCIVFVCASACVVHRLCVCVCVCGTSCVCVRVVQVVAPAGSLVIFTEALLHGTLPVHM